MALCAVVLRDVGAEVPAATVDAAVLWLLRLPARLGKSAQWRTAQAGLKNTEHISFNVLVTVKASRRQVLLFQGQEE